MTNPLADPYLVLTKVYADGARLKQALAETPIEECNRPRTVRISYGVLEKDIYLSWCIKSRTQRAPKAPVRLILKIALYMMLFQNKHRYMVTDNAVALLKRAGKGGAAGFVNAFLRNFDEKDVPLPDGDEGMSVRYSYPLFALCLLREQYPGRYERIMAAESRGVTVRFRDAASAAGYLSREHEETPFENVYVFRNFARDSGFSDGLYTFQSVGSVAICAGVEPCGTLLDACAAPGGKSVLLSERCGHVTAFELHEHRVGLIRSYASRMGRENITAVQRDSSVFDAAYEDAFDGVLCDVPCSGMGTVCENPDIKLHKAEEDLTSLHAVQLAILSSCARYVRPGGCLYYSTCSLFECENDGVVSDFLSSACGFEAERADSPLAHVRTRHGLQFLPDDAFGAGFYFCKLRREK